MFSLRQLLTITICTLTTVLHSENAVESKSAFDRIAPIHLASFPVVKVKEKPLHEKSLKEQLQPWAQQQSSDRDICSGFYQSLTHSTIPTTDIFNTNGAKDLELVCGMGTKPEAHVLNTLPLTTTMGHIYTAYLFDNPTADIQTLKNRQNNIRLLIDDSHYASKVLTCLKNLKEHEATAADLLKNSAAQKVLIQMLFYTNNWPVLKHLKALNTSIIFQDLVSAKNYALMSGMAIGAPAYLAKTEYSTPGALANMTGSDKVYAGYLSAMFAYMAYMVKISSIDAELQAQKIVLGYARALACVDLIAKNSIDHPELSHMDTAHLIKKYTEKSQAQLSSSMKKLTTLLRKNTFKGNESYFSHHGNSKVAFALLLECKDELHELFTIVGELDTYMACSRLITEAKDQAVGYSFAEYTQDATAPSISATNIWHPLVGAQKSVTNSIELGGDKPTNIIITGPNAGGKSTFLKGLTLNVLFAQSLGIVPAKSFVITPFAKINTYMNIADDTAGGNSLFKSEVLRAQKLLDTVKNLPAGQFAFSVMDEMFSGTSPKEGEAASYAVAQKLGSLPNSMLLLATHFQKLTGLEEHTGTFTNYQVRVQRHENGSFSYPFKLEFGKADQNVAIEILQQQGFDSSILDSANAILAQ